LFENLSLLICDHSVAAALSKTNSVVRMAVAMKVYFMQTAQAPRGIEQACWLI